MNRQAYEPDRVRRNTSNWVLDRIEHGIECSIYHYYRRPHEEIALRIEDLDHEWDIERVLEANAAVIALAGTFLGITVSRKYLLVPCVVLGFLVQHAVQGWCPPIPVFRRLGIRTRREIDREKYALKALRGDFRDMPGNSPLEALDAVDR